MSATAGIHVRSRGRLTAKLRNEDGVGLIELLIALLVLNVGIFATLGAFASAATTMRRASHVSTAAALADKLMEGYRNSSYAAIPPACNPTPTSSSTTSTPTGADGRQYTVTTTASCASQGSGGSAFVKQITLQVSDPPADNGRILVTSTSTFSRCTQAGVGSDPALTACQN